MLDRHNHLRRGRRRATVVAALAAVALLLAGCGSSESSTDGGGAATEGQGTDSGGGDAAATDAERFDGVTLTYWASQQSPSPERDREILEPELARFTEATGIDVELEVIPFSELLNKILTATTSGQGPDVLNIGNTWTTSLQASGALVPWDDAMLDQLGGRDRFEEAALGTTGAEGQPPAAIPLYNKVYLLYYNKALFADAGITEPPATWDEFVTVGQQLTKDNDGDGTPDQWGLAVRGHANTVASHYAFILSSAQGASFTDGEAPAFDSPEAVAGISQYLSWMGEDGFVNPSDAENADWADVYEAFAGNRAGMMLVQTLGQTLKDYELTDDDYGVAPMPSPASGGQDVASFPGGTNVAIMVASEQQEASVELVKFLTSPEAQSTINAAYGTLPSVKDATGEVFDTPEMLLSRETIASRAIPMPRVVWETQFESLVGEQVTAWLADTAVGSQPDSTAISAGLATASDKVSAGG